MNIRWINVSVAFFIFLSLCMAAGVLVLYGVKLGPLSTSPSDWGNFGSLMSGAFTLLSSFATIGTLLFLYHQQKKNEERHEIQEAVNRLQQEKHDKITEKQLSALTFDQYFNHRKLFIQRLNEISLSLDSKIKFLNPDITYNIFFENNSPNNCDYNIDISPSGHAGSLKDCVLSYEYVKSALENFGSIKNDVDLLEKLLLPLYQLSQKLGFVYAADEKAGDIVLFKHATGINIYKINEFISWVELVLNSILHYSGNIKLVSFSHLGATSDLRVLVERLIFSDNRKVSSKDLSLYYNSHLFPSVYYIYYKADELPFDKGNFFDDWLFGKLEKILSDTKSIERYDSKPDSFDSFFNIIIDKIYVVKDEHSDNPEVMGVINSMIGEVSNYNSIRSLYKSL